MLDKSLFRGIRANDLSSAQRKNIIRSSSRYMMYDDKASFTVPTQIICMLEAIAAKERRTVVTAAIVLGPGISDHGVSVSCP